MRVNSPSPALAIPAIQASHAPIHHDHSRSAALRAQLRPFREMRLRESIGLLLARFEFGALVVDQLLLVFVQTNLAQHADELQMLFDHMSELGNDGRHETPARLPVTTTW